MGGASDPAQLWGTRIQLQPRTSLTIGRTQSTQTSNSDQLHLVLTHLPRSTPPSLVLPHNDWHSLASCIFAVGMTDHTQNHMLWLRLQFDSHGVACCNSMRGPPKTKWVFLNCNVGYFKRCDPGYVMSQIFGDVRDLKHWALGLGRACSKGSYSRKGVFLP